MLDRRLFVKGEGIMANLSIIKLYNNRYDCVDSCLRTPSNEIYDNEFGEDWLKKFIYDMFETLYNNPSGVGLAANQVGVLKKICVIDIKRDGKKPVALINPSYSPFNDEMIDSQEVCLSFPAVVSNVKRYKKINIVYCDFYGEKHNIVAEGFKAKVLQHEIDHLNGIVHVDLNQNEIMEYKGFASNIATKALEELIKKEEL